MLNGCRYWINKEKATSHYIRINNICKESLQKIFPDDFDIKIFLINLYSQIDQLTSAEKIDAIYQKFTNNLEILKSYNEKIHSMYFYELINAVQDKERIGFFEPFVTLLNNEISVFYADDFTPMINHTINNNPNFNYMVRNIYTQTYNIKKGA